MKTYKGGKAGSGTYQQIINHIQGVLKDRQATIDRHTSLIAKGLLDSLDILALIEFVENKFRIKLGNDDLNPEYFETASSVALMVSSKIRTKPQWS